jgi:predicted aspartyl protease
MRFALLVTVLMTFGCVRVERHELGAALPPSRPSSARLLYEVEGASSRWPQPLVRGTVAGRRTLMVIDTGAHVPVLASWLAREVGLRTSPGSPRRDAGGFDLASGRADHVALEIDGLGPAPDRPMAVIDLPDGFARRGIGAIISPQALPNADEAIVLDLANSEMYRASSPSVADDLAKRAPWAAVPNARLCSRKEDDGFDSRALIIDATIDGVATSVQLDTGSNALVVDEDSDAGRKLAKRGDGVPRTALGAGGYSRIVSFPRVEVRMGQRVANVPAAVGQARMRRCGFDGRVGLEELRACVLIISPSELRVSCPELTPTDLAHRNGQ